MYCLYYKRKWDKRYRRYYPDVTTSDNLLRAMQFMCRSVTYTRYTSYQVRKGEKVIAEVTTL